MTPITDLANKRIGRWTVHSIVEKSPPKWRCVCDCGTERIILSRNLLAKARPSRSCGCLNREVAREKGLRSKKHGMINSPTYKSWQAMKDRCDNPNNPSFQDYGGRGITYCDRWLKFDNFFADKGEQPVGMTLERINNMEGYFPENCRWDTRKTQSRNRRNNRLFTLHGKTCCLTEWAEISGISPKAIYSRLRYGWTFEEAISILPKGSRKS